LFNVGVSQISAGSKTTPGAYNKKDKSNPEFGQFQLGDHRTLNEVVKDVCNLGFLPSFCTACYRSGRTGDRFMELAKTGKIGEICTPNAIATFKEYLLDFESNSYSLDIEKLLLEQVECLPDKTKNATKKMIKKLENGDRDVFF